MTVAAGAAAAKSADDAGGVDAANAAVGLIGDVQVTRGVEGNREGLAASTDRGRGGGSAVAGEEGGAVAGYGGDGAGGLAESKCDGAEKGGKETEHPGPKGSHRIAEGDFNCQEIATDDPWPKVREGHPG